MVHKSIIKFPLVSPQIPLNHIIIIINIMQYLRGADINNRLFLFIPFLLLPATILLMFSTQNTPLSVSVTQFTLYISHHSAGKPDSLSNCTVLNQTYNGFQIECIEGFDGGLQQDFVIEAYSVGNRQNPIIMKSR